MMDHENQAVRILDLAEIIETTKTEEHRIEIKPMMAKT